MARRTGPPPPPYFIGQILGARKRQEDSYGVSLRKGTSLPNLVVVADGMGGHAGGDVASGIAVRTFVASYERQTTGTTRDRLRTALEEASHAISDAIVADPALEGMGTTLIAVAKGSDGLHWISVGDSPLWRFADNRLTRLSEDHSMRALFAEMAERGEMTAEEAQNHPHRNQLRSALGEGVPELVDASSAPLALAPDDWLIAATDGIETLDEGEMTSILRSAASTEAAGRAMLDAIVRANRPRQDNTTICLWQPGRTDAAAARNSGGRGKRLLGGVMLLALVAAAVAGWLFYDKLRDMWFPALFPNDTENATAAPDNGVATVAPPPPVANQTVPAPPEKQEEEEEAGQAEGGVSVRNVSAPGNVQADGTEPITGDPTGNSTQPPTAETTPPPAENQSEGQTGENE